MVSFADISKAQQRIAPYIQTTPIMQSGLLNKWLGHEVLFKVEALQTTGAFKLRGATNFIAKLAEQNKLPNKIVANSSGNHAQAVAYAGALFNVPVSIYCSQTISVVKAAATEYYGAELRVYESREDADGAVQLASEDSGTVWIPPFNHQDIIAGQGTATAEAFQQIDDAIDAVFAPCGGGGLLGGSLIATRHLWPNAQVIGAEPMNANDAAQSLQQGSIQALSSTPDTLADGAATPSVGDLTFPLLQQLDDFYEVEEAQIAYWTQWINHLLKIHVEPTCCMTMAAVAAWLGEQSSPKRVLVLLSGGNISPASMQKIWSQDYLAHPPML